MSTLQNEISWSFSRHELFQTCLKRYYYAYYGAWGGWDAAAPPAARQLYILKRLQTRQQWAGNHAHQALEYLLKHARHHPDKAAQAGGKQVERMRNEFRDSRVGAYRQNPTRTAALFEHEYQVDVSPDEWKDTVNRVPAAVQHFLDSPLWAHIRQLPDDAFLTIERMSHFLLDGLKVWAIPDLVIRENGTFFIYDWKTGSTPLAEHRLQLGVYALLAQELWQAPPEQVEAIAYQPILDQEERFRYTAGDLEDLRQFIRDSADEMLFPLDDPDRNSAGDGSNFDCTDDPDPCATCPYLRVCPRWAAPRA